MAKLMVEIDTEIGYGFLSKAVQMQRGSFSNIEKEELHDIMIQGNKVYITPSCLKKAGNHFVFTVIGARP